ncbi:MAG: efflux RND transporter periplasmic adaptor subunit [Gammaproteobacteria bacterium]
MSGDTAQEDSGRSARTYLGGQPVFRIDEELQKMSGIKVSILDAAKYRIELRAYGNALEISPLLALRSRFFDALAEYTTAEANHLQSQQEILRLRGLHRSEAVSTKKLQQQESRWQADKARLEATRFKLKQIRDEAVLNWGKLIGAWITDPESERLSDWVAGKRALLLVTIPGDGGSTDEITDIYVHRSGKRSLAKPAQMISASPKSHHLAQGDSYFYETDGDDIRPGIRFNAWIPQRSRLTGVMVPESAVVRHLGQTFAYIETEEDFFTRQAISGLIFTEQGIFVKEGLSPGDRLVIEGAQTLLSEEFRAQIPDEDDD